MGEPDEGGPRVASGGPWATRLVGRGEEMAELDLHRRRAAAGEFGCVLVTGEPGMGKSRLVAELLARNRSRIIGLSARAYPLGAASSFGLWAEALELRLRDLPPEEITDLCGGFIEDLASVLRGVAAVQGSAPTGEPPKARVLEGFAVLLRNLSRRLPLVVVLDDVHLADASSWELLAYVANNLPDARLLVVATARPTELADSIGHGVVLALEQRGLVHRMNLGPLGRSDMGELVEAVLGEAAPDALARFLFQHTLGNPLFAIGLLDSLRNDGTDLSAPTLKTVPDTLAERVASGLGSLSQPAARVLEMLAVMERRCELDELARVAEEPPVELGVSLQELTRVRLVREDERGRSLMYEIAHPLIQKVIYQRIGGARRRLMHRTIARVLMEKGRLGESSAHFARSASPGDAEAISALLGAVQQAEERGLHHDALPVLESLVELLPPKDERWSQALDAMNRQEEFVYRGNAQTAVRAMRSICAVLGADAEPARQATAKFRLASFLAWGTGDLEEAETVCREAVVLYGLAGDHRQKLLAENELALIRGLRGDFATLSREAAVVASAAEAAGERFVALQAVGTVGYGAFNRGRFREAEAAFRRSVAIARDGGRNPHRLLVGLGSLAGTLAFEGRVEEAIPLLEEARLLDPAFRESLLLAWETCIWWVAGNFRSALASAREDVTWNAARQSRRRAGSAVFASLSAIEAGRHAEAHGYIASARNVWGDDDWAPHSQCGRWAEALVNWRSTKRIEAVSDLRRAVDSIFETDAWVLAAFAAADLAEVAGGVKQPGVAAQAADLLDTIASRIERPLYWGLAALGRGWASLAGGEPEEAAVCARRASSFIEGTGCRSFAGRVLELRGQAELEFDRPAAVATLEEAAQVFGVCGAAARRDQAIEMLRGLGRPGRRRAAAARGPGSLTRREREVAALAVAGKSTREIARELSIGERTVETHLDNVYAKLGVDSRLELVRHAGDLGL